MYETLLRMCEKKTLGEKEINNAVLKGWIDETQKKKLIEIIKN